MVRPDVSRPQSSRVGPPSFSYFHDDGPSITFLPERCDWVSVGRSKGVTKKKGPLMAALYA